MKKVFFAFILVITTILLVGCGLSSSQLKNISEEYKSSLEDLCASYGLTDAIVEVGSDFNTRDTSNNFYVESSSVHSVIFNSLPSEKAFSFAKEYHYLDKNYNTDKYRVSFTTTIYGKGDALYSYETKQSSLEYLMKYNTSVVTYKDGKLVYDIFHDENQ